jgi:hypothetical protein
VLQCYVQAAVAGSMNVDNATRYATMGSSTELQRDWVNMRSAIGTQGVLRIYGTVDEINITGSGAESRTADSGGQILWEIY